MQQPPVRMSPCRPELGSLHSDLSGSLSVPLFSIPPGPLQLRCPCCPLAVPEQHCEKKMNWIAKPR